MDSLMYVLLILFVLSLTSSISIFLVSRGARDKFLILEIPFSMAVMINVLIMFTIIGLCYLANMPNLSPIRFESDWVYMNPYTCMVCSCISARIIYKLATTRKVKKELAIENKKQMKKQEFVSIINNYVQTKEE